MNKCNYKKRVSILIAALTAVTAIAETVVNCNVRLADNSSVKGVLGNENIVGEPIFQPELTISTHLIKEIAFKDTNGTASVELKNGDRLTMTMATEIFSVSSILGNLDIPKNNIKSLSLQSRKMSDGLVADEGLLFYCSFDSESSIAQTERGPSGMLKAGGSFVDGVKGKAIHLSQGQTAATFDLPRDFLHKNGTIEFWGKIDEGMARMSSGGCPRFFCIKSNPSGQEISQDWNSNNGSGGSGFTFRIGGLPALSSLSGFGHGSYAPIDGTLYKWHHYAFVWDAENGIQLPDGCKTSAVAFIDGKPVLVSKYDPEWTGSPINALETTLLFPTRETESDWYNKVPCCVDEFKIWNYAKTTFDLE
ncbi:MAG: hypothetical protein IKO40_05555 [Kiritimatiellae bacterium]|nr:hypothetical protein [Kiritimatiellia bacterium]